jgi:hypothetical protein
VERGQLVLACENSAVHSPTDRAVKSQLHRVQLIHPSLRTAPPGGGNEMRQPSQQSKDKIARNSRGGDSTASTATETDPLLQASAPSFFNSRRRNNNTDAHSGSIRSRRSSRSPTVSVNQHFGQQQQEQMNTPLAPDTPDRDLRQTYHDISQDDASRSGNMSLDDSSRVSNQNSTGSRSVPSLRRQYKEIKEREGGNGDHPPLLEIPEEIYGVRKAALQVLKPLTKTWVSR